MEINRTNKTITISQNTGVTFSVAFLIMVAGALVTGTTWVAGMDNRTRSIEEHTTTNTQDIGRLKSESTTNQVKFTEIQTQLKSIDATLVEIKERLN